MKIHLILIILMLLIISVGVGCEEEAEDLVNNEKETIVENNEDLEEKIMPNVTVLPSPVPLDEDTVFVISGTGFPPNEEVDLKWTTGSRDLPEERLVADLNEQIEDPEKEDEEDEFEYERYYPETDEHGAFYASFTFGRFERIFFPEQTYTLWVEVGNREVAVPIVFEGEPY